ncbi:MAG: glycosyltransferase family 2 protein [Roseburia sp.]|nr:glycosyltransferase family 2 protein [Roseburia sp.]
MLYSVIIPVYNRKKYIRRCINSILKQSFQDFELILVDDGSVDGTAEICDEYGRKNKKIRVVHQDNGGVSRARNTGLALAVGEFVLFVDSDDYLPLDYFAKLVKVYEKYGSDFWYLASFKMYTASDIQYFQYRKGVEYSIVKDGGLIELIDKGLFYSVVNKVYQVSFIKRYQIRFREDISLGEDLIFNLDYLDRLNKFRFLVLNRNYYIVWGKEAEDSLERKWRNDFYEVQKVLLYEKVKYINKWCSEKRLQVNKENVMRGWYSNLIRSGIQYNMSNLRKAGAVSFILKIKSIRDSPEYLKYVQMTGGRKWVLTSIMCRVFFCEIRNQVLNREKRR